ncbi:hypothetical protein H8356DRAFT_1428018 [Neocallimastix lanati (nom. inval.)]|nr:hypothetical protein H8356DRAFT_1428018 [Neocallimastix sp. JGI-2020a]
MGETPLSKVDCKYGDENKAPKKHSEKNRARKISAIICCPVGNISASRKCCDYLNIPCLEA